MTPGAPAREPGAPQRASRVDRFIAKGEERPKAPWHPVPLVELSVLVGIVLIIIGLLNADERNGQTALVLGLLLASLGGLDTILREHFNGYKSHSLVLAALPAVAVAGILYFARAPWPALVAAAALTFAGAIYGAREAFRRRAGVAFKA